MLWRILAASLLVACVTCATHWRITDSGRIESNDDSSFSLLRPYDLAAFIKQVERQERLDVLKGILDSKDTLKKRDSYKDTPISVAGYQENFYRTDIDCINAGQQLSKFSFYETHFITWRSENMKLPNEILMINQADVKVFKKPYCDIVELPFTMGTFDHLDSISSKKNITMLPETELSSNLLVDSEDFFGHLVNKALKLNSSSWVYLTMASDYFRVKGDYLNSIMCLQRAIHYSPRRFQSIPLLNLSNMLHKLHFINDSLVIALTSVSIDRKNPLLVYYVANIYVTLGELNTSYVWFDKASNMDAKFRQAALKKYAVACHIKLQLYLEEEHLNLQKKLEELNDFQVYSDEWFQLNNKLTLEKSSTGRRKFTQKAYKEFMENSQSTVCNWKSSNYDNKLSKIACKNIPMHYTYFPFENYTLLLELDSSDSCIYTYSNSKSESSENLNLLKHPVNGNRLIMNEMSTNLKRALSENMNKVTLSVLDLDEIEDSLSQN